MSRSILLAMCLMGMAVAVFAEKQGRLPRMPESNGGQMDEDVADGKSASAQGVGVAEDAAIAQCLADLENEQAEVRRRAVLVLGKCQDDPRAERAVLNCLEDADASVRYSALIAVGEKSMCLFAAGEGILRMLKDEDVHIRRLASSMFRRTNLAMLLNHSSSMNAKSKQRLVAALNEAMEDSDRNVPRNLLEDCPPYVEYISPRKILGFMREATLDSDVILGIQAIEACAGPPDECAAALVEMSSHANPDVRLAVAESLVNLGAVGCGLLRRLCKDDDCRVRVTALAGACREDVPEDLRTEVSNALVDASIPPDFRLKLMDCLRWLPEAECRKALLALSADSSSRIRMETLSFSVLNHRNGLGLPAARLLEMCNDSASEVRGMAMRIVKMRSNELDAALDLAGLWKSRYAETRLFCVELIERMRPANQREMLEEALIDEDGKVRAASLKGLMRVMTKAEFRELLAACREDESPDVRKEALRLLKISH